MIEPKPLTESEYISRSGFVFKVVEVNKVLGAVAWLKQELCYCRLIKDIEDAKMPCDRCRAIDEAFQIQ